MKFLAGDYLADEMTTDHPVPLWPHEAIETMQAHPDLVLGVLVESGWRPTDDQLRAMGAAQVQDCVLGDCVIARFPRGDDAA